MLQYLDKKLAFVGVILALSLTAYFALSSENYLFMVVGGLAFVACLSYLLLVKKADPSFLVPSKSLGLRRYLLLNVAFFALITCSLVSVITRADLYTQPVAFFVCMTAAFAILVLEILLIPPDRKQIVFALTKIVFSVIVLVWTPQLMFSTMTGVDTFFHSQFTQSIIQNGHIVASEQFKTYSGFPGMHLNIASAMLLTGLNYRLAAIFFGSFAYISGGIALIYLLGNFVCGPKAGLLAALLLGSSAIFIRLGWWLVPNGFALIFLLAITYVLFKSKASFAPQAYLVVAVLMLALVITHTIAALAMIVILSVSWIGTKIYNLLKFDTPAFLGSFKNHHEVDRESPGSVPHNLTDPLIPLGLVIIYSLLMSVWWLTNSPTTVATIKEFIEFGLSADLFMNPISQSVQYGLTVPLWENLLKTFSYSALWATSFIGCLAAFSHGFTNKRYFIIATSGMVLLFIGFFSIPLGFSTLPERWQYFSVFWLVIPAAIGLLLISGTIRNSTVRLIGTPLVVAAMIFVAITGPLAIVSVPIWSKNTTVRYALEQSEIHALDTVRAFSDSLIGTDYYLVSYYRYSDLYYIGDLLINQDFKNLEGILLIRDEITEKPFSAPGIYRLTYDLKAILEEQGFSKIFSGDTAGGYLVPPPS